MVMKALPRFALATVLAVALADLPLVLAGAGRASTPATSGGWPAATWSAAASAEGTARPLKADAAFPLTATRTADGTLLLRWDIAPGTYLYRSSLKASQNGAALPLATAPGERKDDPNFGPVEVYHGGTEAWIAGLAARGALDISFQGCAEAGICYPVVRRQVDLATLAVTAPGPKAPASPIGVAATPAATDSDGALPAPPAPAAATAPATGPLAPLLGGGVGAMLAAFFGFGLLLAFTPCVFPMLPILSGILAGGGSRPSAARGFALSAAYGLAMAAAYGVLGMAAAWSGANLQAALQAPWAIGLMAALFAALAAAMFGLFDLTVPQALAARLPGRGSGSLAGAAGLGFASALVVGPCVTPPLAGAMLYAAQTGDALRGAAALFMLGLGMAAPLVAVGTFGARILPRSGVWMVRVKQAGGVLFLAVAAVLLSRILPDAAGIALFGLLAVGLGVFLGGLDQLTGESPAAHRLGKSAGLVSVVCGVMLLVGAGGGASDPQRPLAFLAAPARPESEVVREAREVRVTTPAAFAAALTSAGAVQRPTLVAFTAAWCTVCKSNAAVMSDPAVAERIAWLPRILADVTDYGDGERALMSRFDVIGPPTLFLLDAAGRELPGSRHIGALTAADLDRLAAQAGL